ncbi:MAG: hypothetical protein RIQ52_2020 [Pseudomonadota bacterium]|jgi:Holliday junction DNA helicase RuvA
MVIGFLRGQVAQRRAPRLVLDVGGVGYELEAPMSTFSQLPDEGQEVHLLTHLIVREDAHLLYGFSTEAERALFRCLIRVTGIGARMALVILSGMSVADFYDCVQCQDAARLVRLPGIGKKTAERLLIEVRDRLPEWHGASLQSDPGGKSSSASVPASPANRLAAAHQEALSALQTLGFKAAEATQLLSPWAEDAALSAEELIRLALQASVRR